MPSARQIKANADSLLVTSASFPINIAASLTDPMQLVPAISSNHCCAQAHRQGRPTLVLLPSMNLAWKNPAKAMMGTVAVMTKCHLPAGNESNDIGRYQRHQVLEQQT